MTKTPRTLRVVGGHDRPPMPTPEPSVPPATTPEERTSFAEAIVAHMPGWRLASHLPDTITFEAQMCGTRRAWDWTLPVRLLQRDPPPGALLLIWPATKGGGMYGDKRLVHEQDVLVVGVVGDATTPEALGKEIAYANNRNWPGDRDQDPLWRTLEHTFAEYDYQRGKHHHGYGFTAAWVAGQIVEKFVPRYLDKLPNLRREAEQRRKAEAKRTREREYREQWEEASERGIAIGEAKLRALGYQSLGQDPHSFVPPYHPESGRRAPTVFLTGHHHNNYVSAQVILRLSQLPKLLQFLGHRPPRKPRRSPKTESPA